MASNVARMLDIDRLTFADNIRTPECEAIPAMVESFRRHGFKVNHPLVVSEKPGGKEEEGPKYLVLCGNRRGKGLLWLQENEPETYQRILLNGKVPAIVHKGLTREEEVELRIDHSADEDRVPLDEWSIFRAIRQLVLSEIDTQERIAVKLGLYKLTGKQKGQPRREYVQVRVNLARLPVFVQDEFRKLTVDKDSTPLRWANVTALYKAYNAEYVKGQHLDGKGPEFQKVWKELTTPSEVTALEEGETPSPKELSAADAVKRSQSASSQGLKRAFLVVTHQSPDDLGEIDAKLVAAESALQTLEDIREYMGAEEFASLVDVATKQRADREAMEEAGLTDPNADQPAETVAA